MLQVARKDEAAFEVLVRRWERSILAFLARMLGSIDEAEDLAAETFWRVWANAPSYRPSGKFKSWLFRIAGNLARSRLRRKKILVWVGLETLPVEPTSPRLRPDELLEEDERRSAVGNALARLPERQRQAVLLRQYEQMSYREIASAMGTSVTAVETLLHRAMGNLGRDLRAGK